MGSRTTETISSSLCSHSSPDVSKPVKTSYSSSAVSATSHVLHAVPLSTSHIREEYEPYLNSSLSVCAIPFPARDHPEAFLNVIDTGGSWNILPPAITKPGEGPHINDTTLWWAGDVPGLPSVWMIMQADDVTSHILAITHPRMRPLRMR